MNNTNNVNRCKNCINAGGYGALEGFYCIAKKLHMRNDLVNCNEFNASYNKKTKQ